MGFALLTRGQQQLVAFYDADRRMTDCARSLEENHWQLVRVPSELGWDSHNYVTMAVDSAGQIHVSGNMHCQPLVYFRTPVWPHLQFPPGPGHGGPQRDAMHLPPLPSRSPGRVDLHVPGWPKRQRRSILQRVRPPNPDLAVPMESPLFSGGGKMNAYFVGPEQDKSGVFHICWVWRNTPDCATNHDLCYARSQDLARWEMSDGRPLSLPITLATAELVDPVPPGGGMINGNTKLGFDTEGRPVIGYHKFDSQGKTQLYNARREDGGWRIYQTSDWDYRWEFQGGRDDAVRDRFRAGRDRPRRFAHAGLAARETRSRELAARSADTPAGREVRPAGAGFRRASRGSSRPGQAWKCERPRIRGEVTTRESATCSVGRHSRRTATGRRTNPAAANDAPAVRDSRVMSFARIIHVGRNKVAQDVAGTAQPWPGHATSCAWLSEFRDRSSGSSCVCLFRPTVS